MNNCNARTLLVVLHIIYYYYHVFLYSDYWNNGPCKCIGAERCGAPLLFWPI